MRFMLTFALLLTTFAGFAVDEPAGTVVKAAASTTVETMSAKTLKTLNGKAVFKDGVLTVAYDWTSAKQLLDWDFGDTKPTNDRGALRLEPAAKMASKIHFLGDAKITCDLAMGNYAGDHLAAPNGFTVAGLNYNAWFAQIRLNDARLAEAVFNKEYNKTGEKNDFLPVEWSFTPKKSTLKFGKVSMGKEITPVFDGVFTLAGGDGGNEFKRVVISGKVSSEWADGFFPLDEQPVAKPIEARR